MKKVLGGFGEVQEKATSVFPLKVIESRHRTRIQELVQKSATVSPLVPVFHECHVPRGLIHAER